METILAIVVPAAVIFFGALISVGNERQRRAIDNLREQIVFWAIQDLRIKRKTLAQSVKVDDPLGWISELASKFSKHQGSLKIIESFDEPFTLVCLISDNNKSVIFTPYSPEEIRNSSIKNKSRLSGYAKRNPLLSLPRKFRIYEFSILNSGFLFDIELQLVWKALTGQTLKHHDRLWMYEI